MNNAKRHVSRSSFVCFEGRHIESACMILQDMLASTAHGQGPDSGPFPGLFRAMSLFEAFSLQLAAAAAGQLWGRRSPRQIPSPQQILVTIAAWAVLQTMGPLTKQLHSLTGLQADKLSCTRNHCTGTHCSIQFSILRAAGVRVEVQGAARLLLDTPSGHVLAITPTTVACHPLHGGPPQVTKLSCSASTPSPAHPGLQGLVADQAWIWLLSGADPSKPDCMGAGCRPARPSTSCDTGAGLKTAPGRGAWTFLGRPEVCRLQPRGEVQGRRSRQGTPHTTPSSASALVHR